MIDYSTWDKVEELPLEVAACLWIEKCPYEYVYSSNTDVRYQAILKTLSEAVDKKKIGHKTLSNREESKSQLDYDLDDYMGPMWKKQQIDNPNKIIAVERRHLKAWCENNGHKPKFLFPEMRKTEPSKHENDTQNRDQGTPVSLSEHPEWKTKNEREFLLRSIGALSLFLIEKTQSEKFGTRQKPNKKSIYEAIYQLLLDMGYKTEGQTKSTLNDVIKEALELTMK
jgi:hypothetical protein